MNLIVAVDKEWSIGNNGNLLIKIPEDLKRFKRITEGNTVIMGRKTLESLPGQKPLPNRENIVLTRNDEYEEDSCKICHSFDEIDFGDDMFVIGGGQIYEQLLPKCNLAYVTMVHEDFPADTHFPNLDESDEWELKEKSETFKYFDISYDYRLYVRKNKKK